MAPHQVPKPLIYLAGPFRAPTQWGITQNVHAAKEALASAARERLYVVCPHTMTADFQGVAPDEFWLDMTLEMMRRCDAVWVFSTGRSTGTEVEVAEAERLGKPVFTDFGTLLTWAEGWEA